MSATSEATQSTSAFFLLAYLITWAFWVPFVIFGPSASALVADPAARASPFMMLQAFGNFGPTLAAVLLWLFSRERGELKDAFRRLLIARGWFGTLSRCSCPSACYSPDSSLTYSSEGVLPTSAS